MATGNERDSSVPDDADSGAMPILISILWLRSVLVSRWGYSPSFRETKDGQPHWTDSPSY